MSRTSGFPQHELSAQLLRIDELSDGFHGAFGRETVAKVVDATYDLLADNATVTVPQVLFICVHNAGRSQIAAALLEHHAFGKVSVRTADVVVTMGCGDSFPVYPGKRYLDWDVADLAGASPKAVRDDIDRRARELLQD
ncbi:hypothetical protein [Lentzea sp. NBRC 102530]|uniref:hypothetical protein n=1 Tax=Lentzea sp. NBRC 102530 TaxID=3032201 RepID=UPI002556AEF5|nr:hypothetical protein [Lentzea sp. NBRC 102530]